MTNIRIIFIFLLCWNYFIDKIFASEYKNEKIHTFVDPFAGNKSFDSGDRLNLGKLSPGVRIPNGGNVFGPISITGGDNASGYSFKDKWIEGFSPNIIDGTGGFGEFGNFLFIPYWGKKQNPLIRISPLTRSINLPFKKKLVKGQEIASLGSYYVDFPLIKSNYRLTTNSDFGLLDINDYSKRKGGVKIFIDPTRRSFGTCRSSKLNWLSFYDVLLEIECPSSTGGWGLNPKNNYKGYKIYAAIRSKSKIKSIGFLNQSSKRIIPKENELGYLNLESSFNLKRPLPIAKQFIKNPKKILKAFIFYFNYYSFLSNKSLIEEIKVGDFHKADRPIYLLELLPYLQNDKGKNGLISISLSYISMEDALNKYNSHTKNPSFNALKIETINRWEEKLKRFEIEGTNFEKKLFYTALYRVLSFPTYQEFKKGKEIIRALTPFSGYDIHKSHFPFLSIFYPSIAKDQFTYLYKISNYLPYGDLPIWSLAAQESNAMLGTPGPIILTQAIKYNLGLSQDIYRNAIIKSFNQLQRETISIPNNPFRKFRESIIIENSITAKCILNSSERFPNTLNNDQINYLNNIKESFPFEDLKDDFKLIKEKNLDFDISTIESNRLQQSFSIHGSPNRNIIRLGGQERFYKMHNIFQEKTKEFNLGDETNKYFRLENEIVHLAPYTLYYLDIKYRKLIEEYSKFITSNFSTNHNGWPGNDDLGQLSSYLIFNILGMHPISPCDDKIAIFPPVHKKTKINMAHRKNSYNKSNSLTILKEGDYSCFYRVFIDGEDFGPYPIINSEKLFNSKLIKHKYICP